MNSKIIFDDMIRLFSDMGFSPRLNENADEIFVNAPLNHVYEKISIFVHFYTEYYTVDAYLPTQTDKPEIEVELLRLCNLVNYNSHFGCLSLDDNGRVCYRYALSYSDATAENVRESIYLPCYTLHRTSLAFSGVLSGAAAGEVFDSVFNEIK
ncbi:MAG: YbjN domain-containing protein [Oscillospiraceae bacterium]|nr:YbjN domain-containing protein [Oscillospiraceae bacterium]